MNKFNKYLIYGISSVIVLTTYLAAAQGWGINSVDNPIVMKKYPNKQASYGRNNKLLNDSVRKERRRITDSLRKVKKDSLKKIEVNFNKTRDSLLSHGYTTTTLAAYSSGKYLYAYGKRPRYSNSSGRGYSGYSSSSSTGSFKGGSGRSFRGGSRRGGK